MRALVFVVSLMLFNLQSGYMLSHAQVDEPGHYKQEHYRSPVPETLTGATVLSTDSAFALWKTGKVGFVDVFPRAPKPKNLPKGTIFREKKRYSIPGAIWLPNVGYGELAKITERYFKDGLTKISGSDVSSPLVLFCLDECWMSWNAAKRALEYGYTNVFWYPEGTDGWEFENYPTEEVEAEPEPY